LNVLLRPIGSIVLKGKVKSIVLYEPMPKNAITEEIVRKYISAYSKVEQGIGAAEGEFEAMLQENPDDGLVKFHLARIRSGLITADVHMEDK
jgi:adenylate cyclase